MRRLLSLALCLVVVPLAQAQTFPIERWDGAFINGNRAGYVRTIFQAEKIGDEEAVRSTLELRLTILRNADRIQLGMDNGTIETASGQVVGTFMRQLLGRTQKLSIEGVVEGKELKLIMDGNKPMKPAPWNEKVIGLYRQYTLLKEQKAKPGDSFTYQSFEPSINLVIRNTATAKEYQTVQFPGTKELRKALRVEIVAEKVQGFQPPMLIQWLDENGEAIAQESEAPGLGKLVLVRTTKQLALSNVGGASVDVGISQVVKLKQRILRPYDSTNAVYRITVKDDKEADKTFSNDGRQQVKATEGNVIQVQVQSSRAVPMDEGEEKAGPEFLENSFFIACNDARVKTLARTAAATEADPWRKALRIERWVNMNMRPTNQEALATADHVAKTLEGDCTEFAMLTTAMCRAEGIPARTAVGLIYADTKAGPGFAFHMWTEVHIKGRWIPIDATLGRGYVGATHLKIADQSWHDERSMTPLLPVVRVLGKLSIEVVSIEVR
ncbi:MAG: transglutaminase-like domain-containing protein [Gemmataceae bacterium]|nr:transglutaminase-like domain-containing protein [Gemmataceae bacterium]